MAEVNPELRIEAHPGGLTVLGDGEFVLEQHVGSSQRPFIHPIRVPLGAGVLTEDAPAHHPWQHGLYIGLNDVNGVGFWTEGLHPQRGRDDGTFSSWLEGQAAVTSGVAYWRVLTDYLDHQRRAMLRDHQAWELTVRGGCLALDLTWTLLANRDLVFGAYEYGGLFLRTPYRTEVGGKALDSEGQSESGHRARWAAVELALPDTGRTIEAAILDHPGNPGSPVVWRIDNELGIGPSPSAAGTWNLHESEATTFRYRLVALADPSDGRSVEELWREFAEDPA
jgi:Methane oxygenase PmoA